MSKHAPADFADYMPVELRHRHDGWSPARQIDFLIALSESACVAKAYRGAKKKAPGKPDFPDLPTRRNRRHCEHWDH